MLVFNSETSSRVTDLSFFLMKNVLGTVTKKTITSLAPDQSCKSKYHESQSFSSSGRRAASGMCFCGSVCRAAGSAFGSSASLSGIEYLLNTTKCREIIFFCGIGRKGLVHDPTHPETSFPCPNENSQFAKPEDDGAS